MNDQAAQVPPNRKTHHLKTVALVLLGFFALYFVCRYSLSSAIQGRLDSIRRAGLPATCLELEKWYPQPAGENAADTYREAFAHYESWTNKPALTAIPKDAANKSRFYSPPHSKRDLLPVEGKAKLPARTEPLPAEMQQLIAEYLSDNAEALRLLHQAASIKLCRYPVELSKGESMLLPHLRLVRQAARLLYLEAIQNTEEQKPQQAVESVIAALGVARSLNQEPILISYLVHVACQGITLESLERILNRMPLTDVQLAKLAVAIEESENQQALTRAFVGERCMGVDIFQGIGTGRISFEEISNSGDSVPPRMSPLGRLYKAAGLLELDEMSYLDVMKRYVEATRLPPPECIAASHVVNDELESAFRSIRQWHILSRMLLPALDNVVIKEGRRDAIVRDIETAVAIERYRLANGKLPTQLSDLVPAFLPAIPNDPFDGKPLRYKTLTKGYVVYSVGDDREDNDGVEKNSKGVSWVPGTDITFTVER
jgi:hypothetical protein